MEGKAVFGGGQGKGGEADNKLNIDSIIARLLEGDPLFKTLSLHSHHPMVPLGIRIPTISTRISETGHLLLK